MNTLHNQVDHELLDINMVIHNFVVMLKHVFLLLMIGSLGCSPRIVSYTNSNANFRGFETYLMINPKLDSKIGNETSVGYELIKEEIRKEMKIRGYEESTVAPDLILRYEVSSSTRVQTSTSQSFFNPVYQINTRTIHEGVLLLELKDQRKKLVWQGSYDLNNERKEKRIKKVLENAVGRIFTSYPYRAAQKDPDEDLSEFKKKSE